MSDPITRLEEMSLNAWPARRTVYYDGWALRFADGYTRRANSVNPLYPSSLPLPEKIAHCERVYASQGLRTVFKLTPATHLTDLDRALAERGYREEAPTSVQILDLADDALLLPIRQLPARRRANETSGCAPLPVSAAPRTGTWRSWRTCLRRSCHPSAT